MAKVDTSYFEYLSEDLPVFKATCCSLEKIEKKLILDLFVNYYKYLIED